MTTPVREQSGFTLLEVLVALTIFSIGLLAIANMQIIALRGGHMANVQTTSSFVGQGVMEEIQARSDSDPLFAADQAWTNWEEGVVTLEGSGQYTIDYEILVDNPVDGVVRLRVRVDGPNEQITLTGFKRVSI